VHSGVGTLSQFTLTMWMKGDTAVASQAFARHFMAGISPTTDTASNPSIYLLMANGNLQVGVNGFNATPTLSMALAPTDWNFIAVVYDGVTTNPYFSTDMQAAVGTANNMAILTGGISGSVTNVGSAGLNTGVTPFTTSPGPAPLGSSAYAFMANRSSFTRGFDGTIDDVRLYSGLLNTSTLDAIRLAAVPEPDAASLLAVSAFGLAYLRRRRVS
jgi:hypothetical protein